MKVFIGSAKESKRYAEKVKKILDSMGVLTHVWYDNEIFVGSKYTLENLQNAAENFDAALFIWTPDDIVFRPERNQKLFSTRDNVIFETGLFLGRSGRNNICICKSESVTLPSDLSGVTTININKSISEVEKAIRVWINNIGNQLVVQMDARRVIDDRYDLCKRWKYAKEVVFVNYAASSFLIPHIATDRVYPRSNNLLFKQKLKDGTIFRFLITKPNSFAAKDAAKSKMSVMARSDVKASDIFQMSVDILEEYIKKYKNRIEYKLTNIALPYAAMLVINDEQHSFLNHIKIDLYSPYIVDSERRSFIINNGDKNYSFFLDNVETMWKEGG